MGFFSNIPVLTGKQKSEEATALFTKAIDLLEDANIDLQSESSVLQEQANDLLSTIKKNSEITSKNSRILTKLKDLMS